MSRFGLLVVLSVGFFFTLYAPGGDLTAFPKFWRDEAIPFEIARTFYETGKLDVTVAPGAVDGRPYLTHATGFPVTVPLAGFFALFGVGVLQARVYMVLWIMLTLAAVYFVLRRIFDEKSALAGSLLIATFASFYANGRTMTGEIPGFFFLILSLFLFFERESFLAGGFFMALAAVTKPSIYLLSFPALFLALLFYERRNFIRNIFFSAVGALPVILFWIYIILPHPFSLSSWRSLIEFYQHPFNDASLFSKFPGGLGWLFSQTTILYFSALLVLLLVAYFRGAFGRPAKALVLFTFFYSAVAFIYLVRSPGWLRFLTASELFILALVFPAVLYLSRRYSIVPFSAAALLILVQIVTFFFFSSIPRGKASIHVADYINSNILKNPSDTIGFIDLPTVAPLIFSGRKYQTAQIGGHERFGRNPLEYLPDRLPTYVMSYNNDYGEYIDVLGQYYEARPVAKIEGIQIYRRK